MTPEDTEKQLEIAGKLSCVGILLLIAGIVAAYIPVVGLALIALGSLVGLGSWAVFACWLFHKIKTQ